MSTIYSPVRRCDPACGQAWYKFIEWSGLTQLREVIYLDGILCPNFFEEVTAEDWQHNVQEDFKIHLFHDLDYVLSRVVGQKRVNVLALLENPTDNEVRSFGDSRFVFRGFDLMDHCGDISALLNCGGFDKAFSSTDLSDCGLLTDVVKVMQRSAIPRS
jgi:hypothetical protein